MKKIINTIKVAFMCGYTYWKNPHDFTNQSFEFVGNIDEAKKKYKSEDELLNACFEK